MEFEDLEALEELLSEKRGHKVEIQTPQRGQKRAMLALVETNAKHSFDSRFRVLKPSSKAIQEALQDALTLQEAPKRIECFDISHIQGTDKVASMVVWEDGRMKKADYRKFIIRTVIGNDDFASMHEVITRRYSRLQEENKPMPGLILVDGGLGSFTRPPTRWRRSASSTSRWLRLRNARNGFTCWGRRTSRLFWISSRRCSIWCR